MTKFTKILTLAMAFVLILGTLVACGDKQGTPAVTVPGGATVTGPDDKGFVYTAPEVDYDNLEFNILTWTETEEWVMESDVGTTPIDAKTFEHYSMVEHELNIDLIIKETAKGSYSYMGDFLAKISMLGEGDDIDLICQYSLTAAQGAIMGYYVNLLDTRWLNWNAPYWSSDLVETNTFNNQLYYCSGEVTRTSIYNMFLNVFNHSLANKYGISNLYQLVEDGDWTIATLEELMKDVYVDLNHNDTRDVQDLYGQVIPTHNHIDSYQYGCNLISVTKSDMGELEVNPDLIGDYGVTLTDKLKQLFHYTNGVYCGTNELPNDNAITGETAIIQTMIASDVINKVNPSGIDYGILPLPKYNSEQKEYHTCLSMPYSMFSIPAIARDADMSSAVLESMAHNGYARLSPYIFENCLKSRYSIRPEDANMFDYLRNGIIYEPGRTLWDVHLFNFVRDVVGWQNSLPVYYAQNSERYNRALGDLNFAFS